MNCSRYVNIDYEVLDKFIKENEFGEMKHWLSDNPYGLLDWCFYYRQFSTLF